MRNYRISCGSRSGCDGPRRDTDAQLRAALNIWGFFVHRVLVRNLLTPKKLLASNDGLARQEIDEKQFDVVVEIGLNPICQTASGSNLNDCISGCLVAAHSAWFPASERPKRARRPVLRGARRPVLRGARRPVLRGARRPVLRGAPRTNLRVVPPRLE